MGALTFVLIALIIVPVLVLALCLIACCAGLFEVFGLCCCDLDDADKQAKTKSPPSNKSNQRSLA